MSTKSIMTEEEPIKTGFDFGYRAIRTTVEYLRPYSNEANHIEKIHAGLMLSVLVSATEELGVETALAMLEKVKNSYGKSAPGIKRSMEQ